MWQARKHSQKCVYAWTNVCRMERIMQTVTSTWARATITVQTESIDSYGQPRPLQQSATTLFRNNKYKTVNTCRSHMMSSLCTVAIVCVLSSASAEDDTLVVLRIFAYEHVWNIILKWLRSTDTCLETYTYERAVYDIIIICNMPIDSCLALYAYCVLLYCDQIEYYTVYVSIFFLDIFNENTKRRHVRNNASLLYKKSNNIETGFQNLQTQCLLW